jgi:AraC-like DNA-binding protein
LYALSLIAIIGASQGAILALVLFSQPFGFRIANQVLAIFIAIHAMRLGVYHVIYAHQLQEVPYILFLLNLNMALGPLLYCYVKALTEPDYQWKQRELIHYLPTLLMLTLSLLTLAAMDKPVDVYSWWLERQSGNLPLLGELLLFTTAAYFIVYIAMAARRLAVHRQSIEEYFSNIDDKQLTWIWLVIAFCALIAFSTFVEQIVFYVTGFSLGERQVHVTILTTLLIYFLAYKGMRQRLIFDPRKASSEGEDEKLSLSNNKTGGEEASVLSADASVLSADATVLSANATGPSVTNRSEREAEVKISSASEGATLKYEKSGLKDSELQALWDKLEVLMVEQKPYLDSDLKLADLAQQLDLSANYLSQVINRTGGQKFFEYINGYRVQEAARLLEQNRDTSLLVIALDSGFVSPQAFSTRFKKVMKKTPTEYRKSLSS